MKRFRLHSVVFWFFVPVLLWAQGTYYAGIDTGSASFVTDLHNLIYPHTQISYAQFDETNIANFASRDTTGGQKVVTCVYSGQNYVYTPPFAWGTFSREHTWCYSWMPTYGSTSGKEYSDQHHLFPTNQNNANGVRSNHPLGIVTTVTSSFLESKYGKNSSGQNVFEPRDSHKGDAARALLYMAVCYNGVNGNDWTFDHLNTVTLPALSEAPQDVDLLIQWHNQDPPDDWERARNEYIYSIQGNRNPFIDHPEYVGVIDFNTLTKKTAGSLADEPSNYPDGYNSPTITAHSIKITWSDPGGAVLPTGYLLKASTTNSFTDPVNGTTYANQTNLSSGTATVNVNYNVDEYTFTGLAPSTTYYFRLYPYNGNSSSRRYKTASYPLALEGSFMTSEGSSPTDLFISEYVEGSSNNKAIEIYNGTHDAINLGTGSYKIEIYFNGSSTVGNTINLAGTISSSGVFVIAHSSASSTILNKANQTSGSLTFNGNDAVVLKKGSTILDVIGQIGFDPGTEWGTGVTSTADNTLVRKSSIYTGDTNPNDAFDPSVEWDGYATDTFDSLGSHTGPVALPVELTSFTSRARGLNIELHWTTATEVNNYGFEVQRLQMNGHSERSEESSVWIKVGFVVGNGNSNSPKQYSFTDKNLKPGKYTYRLKQIDRDGKFEYSQEVEAEVGSVPKVFALYQNYPNPFNPTTTIGFTLQESGKTTLKIYDAIGREVATLADENLEAGVYYQRVFDAKALSSGIYFARLQSGGKQMIKKLLFLE